MAKHNNNFPRTFDIFQTDGSIERVTFDSIEKLIASLQSRPAEPHHAVQILINT